MEIFRWRDDEKIQMRGQLGLEILGNGVKGRRWQRAEIVR